MGPKSQAVLQWEPEGDTLIMDEKSLQCMCLRSSFLANYSPKTLFSGHFHLKSEVFWGLAAWFGKRHTGTAVWLWTSACPQEDISWLLIHAGGLTMQAKPSARTCQSAKWQLDLFHTWDTTSVLETERVSSVPPFQPFPGGDLLVLAGVRTCYLWLLLLLFLSIIGMWWREH